MRKIKRFAAIILSLGIVLAGSMTSLAAELPGQQPEEPASIEGTARTIILPDYEESFRYVNAEHVYLRAEPGRNGMVVGLLFKTSGDWVYLSGEAEIADGFTWLRVISSSIGRSGWIAKNYVQ